jgi:predicted pyridoxine 5'-phosphate oxidase superfamily flavin-nucleotide-binding protein
VGDDGWSVGDVGVQTQFVLRCIKQHKTVSTVTVPVRTVEVDPATMNRLAPRAVPDVVEREISMEHSEAPWRSTPGWLLIET